MDGRPTVGRSEGARSPSYMAQVSLVQSSGFPKLVGRPALGRPEGAGSPSYMAQVSLVHSSGFPKLVGRPGLGRPEEAGCPRHWSCFLITAEQWRCGKSRTVDI